LYLSSSSAINARLSPNKHESQLQVQKYLKIGIGEGVEIFLSRQQVSKTVFNKIVVKKNPFRQNT